MTKLLSIFVMTVKGNDVVRVIYARTFLRYLFSLYYIAKDKQSKIYSVAPRNRVMLYIY